MKTEEQKQNLRNLIRANRESTASLDMDFYEHTDQCGTAHCVLGNYIARTDLQSTFSIVNGAIHVDNFPYTVEHGNDHVLDHFGITSWQGARMFSPFNYDGDDEARKRIVDECETPQEAADFIEKMFAEELAK